MTLISYYPHIEITIILYGSLSRYVTLNWAVLGRVVGHQGPRGIDDNLVQMSGENSEYFNH